MSSGGGVTQIDTSYLDMISGYLQQVQSGVQQQLTGMGPAGVDANTLNWIEPLTQTTKVQAGASSFQAGAELNSALGSMGSSVNLQLGYLNKVLDSMISEIATTKASLQGTESLNNETVQQLITDFQNTIANMGTSPGSGSGGSSSGSSS